MIIDLKELFGRNVKRLRTEHKLSMSELAKAATSFGVRWDSARVAAIEGGRASVTFESMCVVMWTLNSIRSDEIEQGNISPVSLADLMLGAEEELIRFNDGMSVRGGIPAALLKEGARYSILSAHDVGVSPTEIADAVKDMLGRVDLGREIPFAVARHARTTAEPSDRDNARKMSMSMKDFLAACVLLWTRPMSEEVRLRVGDAAAPQAKGHAARRAKVELQEFIDTYGGQLPSWRELHPTPPPSTDSKYRRKDV